MKTSSKPLHEPRRAKIFKHGGSQAVRIPAEFRFDAKEVLIRKEGRRLVIEAVETDAERWFREMREVRFTDDFMKDGREQPPMPPDRDLWD